LADGAWAGAADFGSVARWPIAVLNLAAAASTGKLGIGKGDSSARIVQSLIGASDS